MLRAYGAYDTEQASLEAGLQCDDPSLTQQHDKDEADINVLVRRFGVTGEVPQTTVAPVYEDFTEVANDYHSAMNLILQANQSFSELPAEVRLRFNNDPGMFVDFVSNYENISEMREMGLANAAEPETDAPTEVGEGG